MLVFSVSQVIDTYGEVYLASRNAAAETREHYRIDLRQLGEYLASVGVKTVNAVQRIHVEGFLAHLDRLGVVNNTRRRKLAAVKSLFKFAEESGYRKGNPAGDVIPPALERTERRYLTVAEYERLRRAVRHEPRDAAIIELLLQTGLGLSEVARLRLTDIELPDRRQFAESVGSARVWRGRQHRMVTLNSKACEALRGYLLVRQVDALDDLVFQSRFRRGMGERSIEDAVSKHLKAAGIWGASVRSLRHTFATHSVKRGTSVKVVQKVLGHASRKTTSVYVELAREEMDKQLQENAL
jgi:site-specific recombinase XerD